MSPLAIIAFITILIGFYSKMAKTTGVNPWMKPSNEREAHKAEQKTAIVRSSDFYILNRMEKH